MNRDFPEPAHHTYPVRTVHNVRIETGEPGTTLAADLFLPEGAGRVPGIVSLLPYRRDALGGAGCWRTLRFFAAHGYAAVLCDLRGVGSSDGPARPPFDPAEADDGVSAVEWAARQPWCSGTVGMWGFSYGAALALRTATRRPEHLAAVVSLMGMLDPERDFVHPGGAPGCVGPLGVWGLGTIVNQLLPPLHGHRDPAEWRRWRTRIEHDDPYLLDLYRHPPGHEVWRSRAIDAGAVVAPTLSIAGWRDLFCDAGVRIYERVAGPRRLLIGRWMHSLPDEAPDEPADIHALTLRWWDRWLAGIRNGVDEEPPVTVHVGGHDPGWWSMDSWHRSAAVTVRFPSTLDTRPATTPRAGRDPTVGPLSGLWGIPNGGFGVPLDQHDDDARGLAFTSAPLTEPLTVIGRPAVALHCPAGGVAGRLVVKLTDVGPDGSSILITGCVSTPAAGAALDEIVLDPVGYRLAPGHRLRVVLSDGAFPRLWPRAPSPHDRELPVRDLVLTLPTASPGQAHPATVDHPPPPEAGDAWATSRPRWEIRRDPIRHRVTVVVGDNLHGVLPSSGHCIEQNVNIRASVQRDAPGDARLRGSAGVDVRLGTGERVAVRVRLSLTAQTAVAVGEVSVDGVRLARRRWRIARPDDQEAGEREGGGTAQEGDVVAGDERLVATDG